MGLWGGWPLAVFANIGPVAFCELGDCVLITSSAEVLVEIGLNVKRASPHKHTFMAAYSNGYIHYAPPAAA